MKSISSKKWLTPAINSFLAASFASFGLSVSAKAAMKDNVSDVEVCATEYTFRRLLAC